VLRDALSFHREGNLGEAATLYRKIIAQEPRNAEALHLLGVLEFQRKNPLSAIELIGQAIRINPNNAAFLADLGLVYHGLTRFDDALTMFARALAIKPEYADALNYRGNALRALNRLSDALASYARALAIRPGYAEALNNRGAVLTDLKRFSDALASYDRAVAINPDYAEALNNRGVVLAELKRFDDALASYDRALAIKPDYTEAFNNRGNALSELGRFEEALTSYDHALAIKSDYLEALHNQGAALRDLRRFEEALTRFDRALALRPEYPEALNSRGVVLSDLKRFDDALVSYDAALAIRPDYVEALYNRANTLSELGRFDEALANYDRALVIRPDYKHLFGLRLFCKMKICDWVEIASDFSQLAEKVGSGQPASSPSLVVATPLSAALQKQCAELFVCENFPPMMRLPEFEGRYEHDRIRLGYFSADFHNHATAHLMTGLFERHDRTRFELTAFSFGQTQRDALRTRLEKAFDRFLEIGGRSDEEVAMLARRLEIDIAVDLKGFTQGSRPGIFAMRPAPTQVNYLGYPGTMGAEYIDYLIADSTLIPEDQQQHYVEKIIYLPDSYQVNDSNRSIAGNIITRAECGLPEVGFVFCCFNNNYKIVPDVFEIWMRLLKAVEGSVLWLLECNTSAMKNLRREAQAWGLAPERVVFATQMAPSEHLARHRLADLFLDTLPYNAHTTASDALWAGLPVLTCLGQTFPGRVSASLLNAIGLPELIAENLDVYEALALELATNRQQLGTLRQRLAANRLTYPLFDTARFTKLIESAYVAMWKQHRAGIAPMSTHVHGIHGG
jgi:predicted O-linked N-acetylglucosamine transferase (SPINDLY family)